MPASEAFAIQPLKSPKVNERSEGRMHLDALTRLSLAGTAAASGTIAEQDTAWTNYAGGANLFDFNLGGEVDMAGMQPDVVQTAPGWTWVMPVGADADYEFKAVEPPPTRTIVFSAMSPFGSYVAQPLHSPPLVTHVVNVDPIRTYRSGRRTAAESRDGALAEIRRRLDVAKAVYTHMSPRDVANYLLDDLGVGQLITARAVGVTPTAVRKWRRGEQARPEHRGRLAEFAALNSLLNEVSLHDPAGWLDIPISVESTVTPLDLFVGGRPDLAVLFGSRLSDPQETLDSFDPDWRTQRASDRDYEVVTLSDGSRSVVPRHSA